MRKRARELVEGARAAIEANRRRIDDLNVYPVPDGDTGTNLTLTVRAIDEALGKDGPDDRPGLAHEISRAALMGARGNSGVILSQIVRGACDALAETDDLARIFRSASDAAYRAVKKPVEGTMLTAIRAMAEAAEQGGGLAAIVARGDETVVATQADAADPDRGGCRRRRRRWARRDRARHRSRTRAAARCRRRPSSTASSRFEAIHQELSRYRYCTVFVVEGEALDTDELEAELEQLGDSLLVVGDPTALKVHVHTDDPGRALSLGTARGTIGGVEIANMHAQSPGTRRAPAARRARCRAGCVCDRRGHSGSRQPRARRELRRTGGRRRRDHEPVDVRHPRRDRASERRGGRPAPQQRQRDHDRRASRGERGEGRCGSFRRDRSRRGSPRSSRSIRR